MLLVSSRWLTTYSAPSLGVRCVVLFVALPYAFALLPLWLVIRLASAMAILTVCSLMVSSVAHTP